MSSSLGKVAVVITGELRTWAVSKRYIFEFFDQLQTSVDYYFVTWSESSDYWFDKNKTATIVNKDDIEKSFNGRNLIHVGVEPVFANSKNTSTFLLKAHLSKIANIYKRRYEFDNNFIYDHVVELRPDVFITPLNDQKIPCKNFEIVVEDIFYDFYLQNNVPLIPDLYFRTTSLGHDIMSTRNTYGRFEDLDKLQDLQRKGFEFDPMLSTRDVHFMLYDFISQRRLLPIYKARSEVKDIKVIRPNVPDRHEPYTIKEINRYYNEHLNSVRN
jgi:hypothetical protein